MAEVIDRAFSPLACFCFDIWGVAHRLGWAAPLALKSVRLLVHKERLGDRRNPFWNQRLQTIQSASFTIVKDIFEFP